MPEVRAAAGFRGTVLAFDFGEKRIGVAVGEAELGIAHPLETIEAEANDARFGRIEALVEQWHPGLFVVGLPLAMDGAEHRLTALARKFGARLSGRFAIETRFVDERLTSASAESEARSMGLSVHEARRHVDAMAASTILDAYFAQSHVPA